MGKKLQESSLVLLLLSGLSPNVACDSGGSKKLRPQPTSPASDASTGKPASTPSSNGAKDSTADSAILNLAQSEWESCTIQKSIEQSDNSTPLAKRVVYVRYKMSFSDSTSMASKIVYESELTKTHLASDERCKTKISTNQASQILGDDVELDSKILKAKLEIGKETSIRGVYELDVTTEGKKTYHLAKISEKTLEIAPICQEDAVKEKLCTKVDGDRPDNRAKTWDMYNDGSGTMTRAK